jgi:hypothetical protein
VRPGEGLGVRALETHWIGPGPEEAPTLIFLHDGLGAAGSGCGHSPHFQRREETLAAMTAFLRKHLAS